MFINVYKSKVLQEIITIKNIREINKKNTLIITIYT
jgi:hypothetical protein